jgi:hypothetical protein
MHHLLILLSPPLRSSLLDTHRLRRPPDYYSPAFTATVLSEPASYRDVILHPKWQHAMAEEIATLERTGMCDLVSCPPHVRLITCVSIRLRLALMVLRAL